jgi:hypothetical protein
MGSRMLVREAAADLGSSMPGQWRSNRLIVSRVQVLYYVILILVSRVQVLEDEFSISRRWVLNQRWVLEVEFSAQMLSSMACNSFRGPEILYSCIGWIGTLIFALLAYYSRDFVFILDSATHTPWSTCVKIFTWERFDYSSITNDIVDKWIIQLNSAHQLGPGVTFHGLLIVVRTLSNSGWKLLLGWNFYQRVWDIFACSSTAKEAIEKCGL